MIMLNEEHWVDYGQENVSYLIGKRQRFIREDRSEIERILEIINQTTDEDYSKYLKTSNSWWQFYHLSEMRNSILNWYEFEPNAELLEVDGGFGALTGLFCDRCKKVIVTEDRLYRARAICRRYQNRSNLEVFAGRIQNIDKESWKSKFDYIILTVQLEKQGDGVSVKEPYTNYLKQIKRFLKPTGKILLTADNRYGIRNFCGARNWQTGKPFDGINRYPSGTKGYEFSNQELQDIIMKAGFKRYKFFYPLPDYRFPQLIYTDDYQNVANIAERLEFYDYDQTTLLVAERNLYEDIVNGGVLSFMANSFLVEICQENNLSDVVYAVVSTDRGKRFGLSTTIHNNNFVKKKPAFPQGIEQINKIKINVDNLEKQGIAVIPHFLTNNIIKMPYIEDKTLASVLKSLVSTSKEQFIDWIDTLYAEILKSSQISCDELNILLTEDNKDVDFGPILSKAYLDMVPVNCFVINNKLTFFDQEFVIENCPARFVLFRALKYTYMSMWNMEELFPSRFFKEKYGFSNELWEIFEYTEKNFIMKIRNHETYSQFLKWKNIDEGFIRSKSDLLELPSDIIKYKVDKNTDAIRNIELDLLKQLQSVCEKYNLQYFGFYGTMIGAVRHSGFVPWDDDIDIVLFREDYNKLLEVAGKEFQEPYFLQTMFSDSKCFYGGYSKLRNSYTTAIDIKQWYCNCNKGISIDIFPLDYCYKEFKYNECLRKRIRFCQGIILTKLYDISELSDIANITYWKKLIKIGKKFTLNDLYNKFNILCTSCPEESEVAVLAKMNWQEPFTTYSKTYFENTVRMNFESLSIAIPRGYKECLNRGGIDYEKYPPEELRTPKHSGCFYDTEVPYNEYEKRFFIQELNESLEGDIIIFGSGEVAEDYLYFNNANHPPLFIVDIDKERCGQYQYGYIIKPLKVIDEIYKDNINIIIAHKDFRIYERLLWSRGIYNYKIFLHDANWALYSAEE